MQSPESAKPVKAVWHMQNESETHTHRHCDCSKTISTFGVRKAVRFSPTSTTPGRFFQTAASIRVWLMCNLSSEKVWLLFECGF